MASMADPPHGTAAAGLLPLSPSASSLQISPGSSSPSLSDLNTSNTLSSRQISYEGQDERFSSKWGDGRLAPKPSIKGARAGALGASRVRDLADDEELSRMTTDELVVALRSSWVKMDAVSTEG